jgi:enoyl-CoA hydratase/carnithine racemase
MSIIGTWSERGRSGGFRGALEVALSEVKPLEIETDAQGVATIWLEQPERPVVVLDRLLIQRLDSALDDLPADVRGVVLASRCSRVWVAGADLVEIDGLSDSELDEYLTLGQRVFGRVANLPCTTVAAITGATLGGGLEIAMHCDEMVALEPGDDEKPYPVGLPEAGLGICPGWGGANMLPARMDAKEAIERTATGRPMKIGEAIEKGLFVGTATDKDGVLALARERARRAKADADGDRPVNVTWHAEEARAALESAELPETKAGQGVRSCVEAGLSGGWAAGLAAEKDTLIALRSTPEAREALEAFFAKNKSKAGARAGG